MKATLLFLLLSAGNQSLRDRLEGAEIGDREQAMTFATDGRYLAERKDAAGVTHARGTWKVAGNRLTVTVKSCSGPHCKVFGTSYQAIVDVVGDRAITVDPTPGDVPFSRGSYYCHHQGCEKRIGIQVLAHDAPAPAVREVVERLIERNVGRNTSAVWWAPRSDSAVVTAVAYCPRDGEGARRAAEQAVADLAGLDWLGTLSTGPTSAPCLWDVQVQVGDGVKLPEPAPRPAR